MLTLFCSYGETAIYLQAMGGSDLEGVTRVDWVRSLFEDERLPVDLGWKPRAEPVTVASLALMVTELFAVSDEKVPEGKKITEDTYKVRLVVGPDLPWGNSVVAANRRVGLC